MLYFFVLGRYFSLSIAEINAALRKNSASFKIENYSPEILLIHSAAEINLLELVKKTGGVVKAGIVIDKINLDDSQDKLSACLTADKIKKLFEDKSFYHFGLSFYDLGADKEVFQALSRNLSFYAKTIKDNLKEAGCRAGFVRIKDRFLSSVSVAKNLLKDKGVEIVFLASCDNLFLGKTVTVQDFEGYCFRDVEKPRKDKRSGIMPAKLARIMLNLAQVDKNAVLLDPFCGSGTIILEAIFLGIKSITGSDISKRAISDTKENINWLFKSYPLSCENYHLSIIEAEIVKLASKIGEKSIDAIVTESYLGPPLYQKLTKEKAKEHLANFKQFYLSSFSEFARILKKDGQLVIALPAFYIGGEIIRLEIEEEITRLGFARQSLLPKEIKFQQNFSVTRSGSLIYGHRDQFILREISWLKKIG